MSDTHLYAGEAEWEKKYVHVLAYQNKAKSSGPNAMLLPLPAKHVGPENAVDTRAFPRFLTDIGNATRRVSRSIGTRRGGGYATPQGLAVFDVGSYSVLLAERPLDVVGALERITEAKRPVVSEDILASFAENYPGSPLAVCCWNGAIAPEPLLWWYEPQVPDALFMPALDAHDGLRPDLSRWVDVDHMISVGSTLRQGVHSGQVSYRDQLPPQARALLPSHVSGTKLVKTMQNGDFISGICDTSVSRVSPRVGRVGTPVRLAGWS